jgi:hypothetical protein
LLPIDLILAALGFEMAEDRKRVSLQLCHNIEKDTLRVSFAVGVNVGETPSSEATHALTVVSREVEGPCAADAPAPIGCASANPFTHPFTLAICDPGGLLAGPDQELFEFLIAQLVKCCEMEEGSDAIEE